MSLDLPTRPPEGAPFALRARLGLLVVAVDTLTGIAYIAGHASGVHPLLLLGVLHLALAALHYLGRGRE
jgi:hypothetical protein